jgi:hypothetical protein
VSELWVVPSYILRQREAVPTEGRKNDVTERRAINTRIRRTKHYKLLTRT